MVDIKQRRIKQVRLDPNAYDARRIAEMEQERCDRCDNLWPTSMMTIEDGLHVCPNDVDTITAEFRRKHEEEDAAWVAKAVERPQLYPPRTDTFTCVTGMVDGDGAAVSYGHPLRLVAGGAARGLVLSGVNLSTTDTVSVSAGMNVSVTVNSETQVTLSVSADAGLAAGDYPLTYNDSVYRGLFRVR